MEASDFWTHVALVTMCFLVVVGPRLLSPGHEMNSLIFIVGGAVVIVVAAAARSLTMRHRSPEATRP